MRARSTLKATAARDPKAASSETAKQFESLFMQELMKSMRSSTMSSGMLDNPATDMGTEMLDTQFASKMTGLPAACPTRSPSTWNASWPDGQHGQEQQRSHAGQTQPRRHGQQRQQHRAAARAGAEERAGQGAAASSEARQRGQDRVGADRHPGQLHGRPGRARDRLGQARDHQQGRQHSPTTSSASRPAATGRARSPRSRPPRYIDGQATKVTAKFRAYGSYDEAFRDYASLITGNERYKVVANAATPGLCARLCRRPATPPTPPTPTS
jgi:flagellar protein FlgJ